MPKAEWGTKRLCPTSGKRFYDLNKNPIISPYTGETVTVDSSKTRMIAADAEDAVTAKAKEAETEDDAVLDDDDDVDVVLGDDILKTTIRFRSTKSLTSPLTTTTPDKTTYGAGFST